MKKVKFIEDVIFLGISLGILLKVTIILFLTLIGDTGTILGATVLTAFGLMVVLTEIALPIIIKLEEIEKR